MGFLVSVYKNVLINSVFLADYTNCLKRCGSYQSYVYSVLNRFQLQRSKADKVEADMQKEVSVESEVQKKMCSGSRLSKYSCKDEDLSDRKGRLELAWLTKALEPALQLCRWALPTGLFMFSCAYHLII